jgi:hypothetical protein
MRESVDDISSHSRIGHCVTKGEKMEDLYPNKAEDLSES